MGLPQDIKKELGDDWIPHIYSAKVRSKKTRAFEINVSEKENRISIVHTLLGIQLKAPAALIACPDLSTARYLRVFARIGCSSIAVPYDITRISSIADELESSWHRTLLLLDARTREKSPQVKGRYRGNLVRRLRIELNEAGAGDMMPAFNTETRQSSG